MDSLTQTNSSIVWHEHAGWGRHYHTISDGESAAYDEHGNRYADDHTFQHIYPYGRPDGDEHARRDTLADLDGWDATGDPGR